MRRESYPLDSMRDVLQTFSEFGIGFFAGTTATGTLADVFAEIQLQLQERGDVENITEVVSLDAALLEVTTESRILFDAEVQVPIASVRFSGTIKEEKETTSFNEVWHFQKDLKNSRWLVTGIQQN